jgi:hypothetical protein
MWPEVAKFRQREMRRLSPGDSGWNLAARATALGNYGYHPTEAGSILQNISTRLPKDDTMESMGLRRQDASEAVYVIPDEIPAEDKEHGWLRCGR